MAIIEWSIDNSGSIVFSNDYLEELKDFFHKIFESFKNIPEFEYKNKKSIYDDFYNDIIWILSNPDKKKFFPEYLKSLKIFVKKCFSSYEEDMRIKEETDKYEQFKNFYCTAKDEGIVDENINCCNEDILNISIIKEEISKIVDKIKHNIFTIYVDKSPFPGKYQYEKKDFDQLVYLTPCDEIVFYPDIFSIEEKIKDIFIKKGDIKNANYLYKQIVENNQDTYVFMIGLENYEMNEASTIAILKSNSIISQPIYKELLDFFDTCNNILYTSISCFRSELCKDIIWKYILVFDEDGRLLLKRSLTSEDVRYKVYKDSYFEYYQVAIKVEKFAKIEIEEENIDNESNIESTINDVKSHAYCFSANNIKDDACLSDKISCRLNIDTYDFEIYFHKDVVSMEEYISSLIPSGKDIEFLNKVYKQILAIDTGYVYLIGIERKNPDKLFSVAILENYFLQTHASRPDHDPSGIFAFLACNHNLDDWYVSFLVKTNKKVDWKYVLVFDSDKRLIVKRLLTSKDIFVYQSPTNYMMYETMDIIFQMKPFTKMEEEKIQKVCIDNKDTENTNKGD
jgi:hypothetical protein